MSEALLEAEALEVRFGAVRAVDGASLRVATGTITGLIGPNGAGKSTLFNAIVGEVAPAAGTIRFRGARIDGLSPDAVFSRGLARTFQIPRPFAEMTVLENLMLAAPDQPGERFWAPLLAPGKVRARDAEIHERAREILDFATLAPLAHEAAGRLSGGQQKLLELARVLMADPALILLDEPAAGVAPTLTRTLIEKIEALNARGVSFLIIEHDMDLIMRHCDPVVAMSAGRIIFEGSAAEAMKDARLLDAYLGDAADG